MNGLSISGSCGSSPSLYALWTSREYPFSERDLLNWDGFWKNCPTVVTVPSGS